MEVSDGYAETFSVKKQQPIQVGPATTTRNGLYFLSNLDQIIPCAIEILFAYKGDERGRDTATAFEVIKEALAKILVEYYPIAGCLTRGWDGKMMVRCSGEGVPFVKAISENEMAVLGDINIIDPVKLRKLIHFNEGTDQNILDVPLLTVQVTRFKCGGIIVGVRFNHMLMDGKSLTDFISSWAKVAREEPLSDPYLDRSILSPRQPPVINFPHDEYTKKEGERKSMPFHDQKGKLVYQSFCFDPKKLTQLKRMATDCDHQLVTPTSFELISALVWISRTKALKIKPDQATKLLIVVDGRSKFKPPLPKAYFGNGIAWSCAQCKTEELTGKPFSFAVKMVHEAINSVTEDYVRSAIDYFEVTRKGLEYDQNVCWITKWSRLPLYDANFGWGEPTQVAPASTLDNLVLVVSQGNNSENTVVSLGLPFSAMAIFRELIQWGPKHNCRL
ncbi:hypothetical protein F0562_011312 [Nyssa sinensis]|uniref:Omega-hydroxypalmitate O-feruloyl transferase n=1 Tax=Nyssa sinensis TaxID=561372 RepID=A0A5J5A3J9_9ASTE|nr:hypothetical protein F0562_011312 [Nyssa sinensis]